MHKSIVLCDGLAPDYLQDIEKFLEEWEGNSQYILVKTSGSTGTPKEITLDKERVTASAKATGAFFQFRAGQTALLNLSPNYIAGKLMIVRALVHGMKLLVGPSDRNPLLNLAGAKIDFAAFVPYQVESILRNPESRSTFEKISNVIIGGAQVSTRLSRELKDFDNNIFATFGMTETITHFALKNLSKEEASYTCLPGFEVKKDARGCLVIKKSAISEELITNDQVELISDTEFQWKGRVDHVINSGGVKVSPEIIEPLIEDLMQGRRFYFHGKKSKKLGEQVVLYVEGAPFQLERITEEINKRLSKYSRPKEIQFVPQFEETPTGKIKRKNY